MKRFACLFALATFAAVVPSYGQSATDQAAAEISTIHRPTPKPGSSAAPSTTAAAPGPADAGLYKDGKGNTAATSFTRSDTIYVVGKNISVDKGDKMGVTWYGDGVGDKSGKSRKLTSSESAAPDKGVYGPAFHLSPPPGGGTPVGKYHVDVTVKSKVIKRLPFTVK